MLYSHHYLGWNINYPFAIGDLRDSNTVLHNYLEFQSRAKVPWDDLKYIFGEIMYGGHIVDSRDRLLCITYLDYFMKVFRIKNAYKLVNIIECIHRTLY